MTRMKRFAIAMCLSLCGSACAEQPQPWRPADPSQNGFLPFVDDVLPVLLRDCGFHTCHGSSERFFRVWGPGRARIDPTTREFDKLTADEWEASYNLAISMVDGRDPARSLLLRKPLAIEAGGAAHRGVDRFGRNIYRSTTDAGYMALRQWVLSLGARAPSQ
jgi:hypothetical protein